ncbi:MAG: helix-turn-helix domain-containing protein [Actinomycetota bacterium]|nr:helix-turn-helix domain-containing protein [Actinomycetota bacterium]
MDEEADDSAETALIQAFAAFVRSAASGEPVSAAAPEPLLSIADAARYLNASTTTVRNLAVGGKVRSTRVGDRIRFRRTWLDEWIDAGGGEVPAAPPAQKPPAQERIAPRLTLRPDRRRAVPRPKPPTYIQRVGDQELRLLSESSGGRGPSTWHIGVRAPLCEATGHWTSALKRWPRGFMCKPCLTAIAALPEADQSSFEIGQIYMMRLSHRGESATVIRAGYHAGDGRRTLCGKKDGPWVLTEREPRSKQCFVCEHRRRWDRRNLDENHLVARPLTPLRLLIDAGPVDPRLLDVIVSHPGSLEARHVKEPIDDQAMWGSRDWVRAFHDAEPIGRFAALPILKTERPDRWSTYTISDRGDAGATTEFALGLLADWAADIERAADLYARWAKEPNPQKRG